MNICYLCGHEMVTEEHYKENKQQFDSTPKFNHYEHIIQNALYGKLKPNNILCKDCGNSFSSETDKGFVNLFSIITETIKDVLIRKDHGNNNSPNTLKGLLYTDETKEKSQEVFVKNGLVTPKDPYYEYDKKDGIITIYANKQRAKQHKNVVENILKEKGIDLDQLTFKVQDNIADEGILGLYFSEGVKDFNQKFSEGITKIAVGFATYCSIDRRHLSKSLKINPNNQAELIYKGNILPFVSIGAVDSLIEINRPKFERHYPSHTLILFSQKSKNNEKHLYCYIDLFSTFQYYVLLNDNYKGDAVYQCYHQAIAKVEKQHLDIADINEGNFNIVAENFGIDMTTYKGKSFEDKIAFIEKAIKNYSFNPILDLKDELDRIHKNLSSSFVMYQSNKVDNETADSFKTILGTKHKMAYIEEMHKYAKDKNNGYKVYRKTFLEDDGSGKKVETMYTPVECNHNTITDTVRKAYCHMKFEQITNFMFKDNFDKL